MTYIIDNGTCAPCKLKENKKSNKFKSCYSKDSLIKIAKLWNEENPNKKKININLSREKLWNQIQDRLNEVCKKDEYCWKKQNFVKKIKDIEIELYTFKPRMPNTWLKNKNTWLNTYDIYYVMKQYEKTYNDFVFLGPIPADCPVKINCELSKLDLMNMKKKGINKIGIIYNLDISTQSGSHWVAVYIDNKNNEINYYDSYSGISTPLITKFIHTISEQYTKNNINPVIIYNDKRHQYGGSECGMYSMNFILERLHGKTMYDISKMTIPDSKMTHLRDLLYNNVI
jgi:hypothetical protein